MKNLLIPALMLATITVSAQDLPAPSPKGKVEQVVGLTNISVEYSRPSMKGRKIFGDLVPFDKVWRTGANLNTMISFDGPVKIEGQTVEAGTYSIYTIPGAETWQVILNKNIEGHGEGDRKEEEDVLKVKVPAGRSETFETLTILFDNVKNDKAEMQLRWENTLVKVNIEADATEKAMANIKEALAKPDAGFGAYHGAARFLLERDMDAKLALEYAKKSVSLEKKFWNQHTLALALAKNGQHKEAIAAAEESMKLAEEAKADNYVKMNKEKIAEWGRAGSAPAAPNTGAKPAQRPAR